MKRCLVLLVFACGPKSTPPAESTLSNTVDEEAASDRYTPPGLTDGALWTLQASLGSPEGYQRVAAFFGHPLVKVVLIGLVWAYLHHLIAGVRHLLADIHIGLDLASARQSAAVTLMLGILLTLAIAVKLW
jgi:succinate dehydrogenase cytochrome b556 subunit